MEKPIARETGHLCSSARVDCGSRRQSGSCATGRSLHKSPASLGEPLRYDLRVGSLRRYLLREEGNGEIADCGNDVLVELHVVVDTIQVAQPGRKRMLRLKAYRLRCQQNRRRRGHRMYSDAARWRHRRGLTAKISLWRREFGEGRTWLPEMPHRRGSQQQTHCGRSYERRIAPRPSPDVRRRQHAASLDRAAFERASAQGPRPNPQLSDNAHWVRVPNISRRRFPNRDLINVASERNFGAGFSDACWITAQGVIAQKWRASGEKLEQNRAEAVNIGCRV